MKTTLLPALAVLAATLASPVPVARADDNFAVSFGGLVPDGPAELGTFLGFSYGMRPAPALRLAGEIGWYRHEYYSTVLVVSGNDPLTGRTMDTIASTQIFPFLATTDLYHAVGSGRVDLYGGGGAGFSVLHTTHYPEFSFRDFSDTQTGFAYLLRFGISTHPGQGGGALFSELLYLGSTIDGDDEAPVGSLADVRTRAGGWGFRAGYRW